jgi:hypothetical protein
MSSLARSSIIKLCGNESLSTTLLHNWYDWRSLPNWWSGFLFTISSFTLTEIKNKMSDNNEDHKKEIDFFLKMMETQGVAVSTVKDGHLIMFKRTWLEDLLKAHPNPEITIFIKRPDFNGSNSN